MNDLLSRLGEAKDDFHQKGRKIAFALSATTGAGKTVIASTVIEALFTGAPEFDVEADPTAVILWVTDDPSLNDQTRTRILESADRLTDLGDLSTIDESFVEEKFEPGRLYFLNVQKLAANTTYVKRSDAREFTLWDTIANTVSDDELTFYVVLDEAHRGMGGSRTGGNGTEKRSTIVQRLINGHEGIPPVPIVWGISATIERFDRAMHDAQAEGRTNFPPVNIDPAVVQESGLLKDTIVLDFPDEKGNFQTALLRTAVAALLDGPSKLWDEYTASQELAEPVAPLIVVQVGNKPSDKDLLELLDAIHTEWPSIEPDALANVFGEHKTLEVGKYRVPYIAPQDVQDAKHVRVLLAKDAVSTGWDCPRAEVLYSLRPADDRTHITQLLGRMVRTPLARRILSDERLNSVSCFLPRFNVKTAIEVANHLTGRAEGDLDTRETAVPGRKVLIAPIDLSWNSEVPEEVRDFLATLPSEPKPNPAAKPTRRLFDLASALSWDKLVDDANKVAMQALFDVLDGQTAQHSEAVAQNIDEIHTAEIRRITAHMSDQSTAEETLSQQADEGTVADAFRTASRTLSAAIANPYVKHLVEAGDSDDPIHDAQAKVAALLQVSGVFEAVEKRATKMAQDWLAQFYVDIQHLSDERRAVYADIQSQAREPEHQDTVIPEVVTEESKDVEGNLLPTRRLHVLSDTKGDYPVGRLNEMELKVLDRELKRKQVVAWYRNPSHATAHSIRVPYKVGDVWRSMQPDFVFISRRDDGELAASIVDPHSSHLADALSKLGGLASFAERHGDAYLRIDALDRNADGVLAART